jgi:hypothetical protein
MSISRDLHEVINITLAFFTYGWVVTQIINTVASMIRTLIIDASRIRVPFRDFWHHYVRVPCLIADATSIAPMACVS